MTIEVRPSVESDIHALKDRLRREDAEETLAAGNASPERALAYSFSRSSACYTVGIDGVPVAMFGIVPDSLLGHSANVWFLGAPEMARIKKSFVRQSRRFIATFLSQYELWNFVDARYKNAVKWLIACGADFESNIYLGRGDVRFYRFTIRRS